MIRRFNYTNRIKIPRERVDIALHKDNEGKYFSAKINLDGLNFPGAAKVFIEPNYKGVYQRFDFGTVGDLKEPISTRLNELPETELAYFDISIVDESEKIGLLLGKARGIPVSSNDMANDRIPLLHVNPTDLGDQFWKLTFDSADDNRPVLEINNKIPELHQIAKNDPSFISLVYPIAFRGVVTKIVTEGDYEFEDDHWIKQWLKFINTVLGIKSDPPAESEDGMLTPHQEDWIDECVNEYCKKFQLFEKFTSK
jgi:hypothetical protein